MLAWQITPFHGSYLLVNVCQGPRAGSCERLWQQHAHVRCCAAGGAGPQLRRAAAEVDPGILPQLEKLPFTLQQAITFRMAARCGAVKPAALALGVSPGAVSRSISLLEQVRVVGPSCRASSHTPAFLIQSLEQ
jgi:hypothetical protein